jgi:hypothetical protein
MILRSIWPKGGAGYATPDFSDWMKRMLQEFLAHPKGPALSVGLGRKAIVTTLLATADEVIQ